MIRIIGMSLLALFVSASSGGSAPVPSDAKNAKDQLAGKWKVIAMSEKGEEFTTDGGYGLFHAIFEFNLKDNTSEVRLTTGQGTKYTFLVLDCQKASGKMECRYVKSKGYMPKFRAIYKIEDNTLLLSFLEKYDDEDKTDWPQAYTTKNAHRKAGEAESECVIKLVREK